MFYIVSKVLGFLLQPSGLALAAAAAGVWRLRRTAARRGMGLAAGGLAYLLCAGLFPLGSALMLPLEQVYAGASLPPAGADIRGLIILGGAEDGRISLARGGLTLNEAGERITEGARLARRFPQALVVFSGGTGRLWPGEAEGTQSVARFLADMGVAPARILLEPRSRTTYENALFTRDLVKPQPGERWLLVTSAYHMPRAAGVFRQAGFDVVPVPVDYRTSGADSLLRPFDGLPNGLERTDTAVREWLGLAGYWLLGRLAAP